MITALGIVGTGIYLPMLAAQNSFTMGRADTCSLQVDRKYLAPVHVRIERIAPPLGGIRVVNVSSGKNDLVLNGEVAKPNFIMEAGDWFEIGESRYFALSDEMRLARPVAMEILGIRQHGPIDDLLIAAVKDSSRHILLIGEQGCDQERLGRVIHHISHRRQNLFCALSARPQLDSTTQQAIRDSCSGTLLSYLYQKGKLDQRVVAMITNPAMRQRLIVCAPSRAKIEASFPVAVTNRAIEFAIPSLRERAAEIPELLDQWLIERGSTIRFAALRQEVRDSLLTYDWPNNLQGLRESADHLSELAQYRSARQAAKSSRITRSTLRGWVKRLQISLKFPLVPDRGK